MPAVSSGFKRQKLVKTNSGVLTFRRVTAITLESFEKLKRHEPQEKGEGTCYDLFSLLLKYARNNDFDICGSR